MPQASSGQQNSQTSKVARLRGGQEKLQLAAGIVRQDSLHVLATVFQAALHVAQAAQYASHASGPQAVRLSPQPSTQEGQSSTQLQLALPNAPTQNSTTVPPSVRHLQRCQPIRCLMHQVHFQAMVQFGRSTATLRVGRALKAFCLSHVLLQAGSAAPVHGSICPFCLVPIKMVKPRRSCRDELTPCVSQSRSFVRPEVVVGDPSLSVTVVPNPCGAGLSHSLVCRR